MHNIKKGLEKLA